MAESLSSTPAIQQDSTVLLGTQIANVAHIAPNGDATLILANGTTRIAPLAKLTLLSESPAYRDGLRAYRIGKTLDQCPFPEDSCWRAVWTAGWEQDYTWKEE